MKKLIALLMVLCLGVYVVGCGQSDSGTSSGNGATHTGPAVDPGADPATADDPAAADAAEEGHEGHEADEGHEKGHHDAKPADAGDAAKGHAEKKEAGTPAPKKEK